MNTCRRRHNPGSVLAFVVLCLVVSGAVPGCAEEATTVDYVARVGDRYLTTEELTDALRNTGLAVDSVDSRRQIIERWIDNELLFQEALRRGLRDEDDVQRLLAENERSVLISAVLEQLYDEHVANPSYDELKSYFDQNREQLGVLEPFVRLRFYTDADRALVEEAAEVLRTISRSPNADSLWSSTVSGLDENPQELLALSSTYYPERHLFLTSPTVRSQLAGLRPGRTTGVQQEGDQFFVLQLVDRVPAGSTPELTWIEDELRQRLIIQSRKLMYARQVQRLRTEALAREQLDMR